TCAQPLRTTVRTLPYHPLPSSFDFLLHTFLPRLPFSFFFNDPATTEIYTLSLHDALPICSPTSRGKRTIRTFMGPLLPLSRRARSEEHTSELQSRGHLVCRLLLEKKKTAERARPSRRDHSGRYRDRGHGTRATSLSAVRSR